MPNRKPPSQRLRRPILLAVMALFVLAAGAMWWFLSQHAPGSTVASEPIEPAEQALRDAARRAPQDPAAQRELGAYLLQQQRPFEAIWAFQDALEARPADEEARLGIAQALIAARLPRLALTTLSERRDGAGPANSPPNGIQEAEQRAVAASAYLAMGDAFSAVGLLSPVEPSLEPAALLSLGAAAEAVRDDSRAEAAYRRLLQSEPESVEGHLALGRLAARHGQREAAIAALTQARRAAPADPRPLSALGNALQSLGGREAGSEQPGGAIDLFRRALLLDPEYGPAHRQLGLWHLQHGRPASAVDHLERAVAAGAGGDDTRLRLAEALQQAGRPAAAAYQRGQASMAAQQPQKAVLEFQRMADRERSRPHPFLLLSSAYAKMDESGRAAEAARKGLERHPTDTSLLARLAQLLLVDGDRDAGARLCRAWQARDPAAAEPYRLLGSIERAAGRHAEAARLYEQAMARDPQNAEYCREMARALVAQADPAGLRRAADLLSRAVTLDPGSAESRLMLGDVLQQQGDLEGARLQLLRGLDQDPSSRTGVVTLAQLCPRLGKGARAGFYSRIIRALQEREDAARPLWRAVFGIPADADAHARLASLLLEAADLPQARHQLAQALAIQPSRKKEKEQLQIVERLLALREW